MGFMTDIVEWLNEVTHQFYEIYLEVLGWPEPFWRIYAPFYFLYNAFNYLAWNFHHFGTWVNQVVYELTQILSWDTIWSNIKSYIPDWDKIGNWSEEWTSTIVSLVTGLGSTIRTTIEGWIDIATEGLASLLTAWDNFWNTTWPQWTGKLDTLGAAWDNFWTVTLPTLLDFSSLTTWWNDRLTEIDTLISDTLKIWFPFRDDLVRLWDTIAEFFISPFDWLANHIENWFWEET